MESSAGSSGADSSSQLCGDLVPPEVENVQAWPVKRLKQYLLGIRGMPRERVAGALEKSELVSLVQDVHVQCLRIFGVPPMCDVPGMVDMLAGRMTKNVQDALRLIEREEATWLDRMQPDWTDGISILRSVFLDIDKVDIPSMTSVAKVGEASAHSFAVMVTLMKASKYGGNCWTQAMRIWGLTDAPCASNVIRAKEPESFWSLDADTLGRLFQRMDIYSLSVEKEADCVICGERMVANERVRQLRCGHYFHAACIAKWVDTSIPSDFALLTTQKITDIAYCPLCRAGTGLNIDRKV